LREKFDLLQIKLILFFLVAFIVLTFLPSEVFADWYDSSWEHRKKITSGEMIIAIEHVINQ